MSEPLDLEKLRREHVAGPCELEGKVSPQDMVLHLGRYHSDTCAKCGELYPCTVKRLADAQEAERRIAELEHVGSRCACIFPSDFSGNFDSWPERECGYHRGERERLRAAEREKEELRRALGQYHANHGCITPLYTGTPCCYGAALSSTGASPLPAISPSMDAVLPQGGQSQATSVAGCESSIEGDSPTETEPPAPEDCECGILKLNRKNHWKGPHAMFCKGPTETEPR